MIFSVLVVEDSESFAKVVAETIETQGHNVKVAYTMAAAMALLAKERFQAIVLDLGLTDSTVAQTTAALWGISSQCERLIVVTGHHVDVDHLMTLGATTVLEKTGAAGFFRDLLAALNGGHPLWNDPKTPT